MKKQQKQPSIIVQEEQKVVRFRETYARKYPWLFAVVGAFGIVATFYGFEKLIDKVDIFVENPWILLITGLVTLAVTGTFYNKLK
jgi:type VI protein secretion system component VasF